MTSTKRRRNCLYGGFLLLLVAALLWLVARQLSADAIPLPRHDEAFLRREVHRRFPVGSRVVNAKAILKRNGFDCTAEKGETSGEAVLVCSRSRFELPLFDREWRILIYYRNEVVSKTEAYIFLHGL